MSNRTWFYASEGQQKGPFPEAQLRDLIARGTVRGDTLVWTEGMSGWQKAVEIPGLVPGAGAPPAMPMAGGPPQIAVSGSYSGGPLSIDPPVFPFFGRALLMIIGGYLVIPAPWTYTGFYRWFISQIQVPGRPNLGFTGQPMDIWYVFVVLGLLGYASLAGSTIIQLLAAVLGAYLAWMVICWLVSHLTSDGRELPISFKGSPLVYVGWYVGFMVSVITIIGWAWVLAAWMRWQCANIEGTSREVIFTGTGLEVLWRSIVFTIGCGFLIPIPWVLRWYTRWFVSQFALVERGAAV
ncbi:DUF4339 domain-containing protein [Bradyrhizobium jicamae]|uniref:DUF4339 domain-containing protein n=1 Tax=Bradyrhizobium jicamae TaxID=280332 RepID=UPI001BA90688|nr:DUF4339 domain-containing protein [Bradyrhizobium jicamae]MBR0758546.1 DUF4339 domain-containing protein [Bradyrhizobium jicamae]